MSYRPLIALGAVGAAQSLLVKGGGRGTEIKPFTESHLDAVAIAVASTGEMPCGVEQVTDHGIKTVNFGGHWDIQKASLLAEFGPASAVPLVGAPAIDRACCERWCKLWIDMYESARKGTQAAKLAPKLPSGALANHFENFMRVVQAHTDAKHPITVALEDGKPIYKRLHEVMRATALLANSMDSSIHVDLSSGLPSNAQIIADSARGVANKTGDAVGFGVESILVPIVGAGLGASLAVLGSTLAPYAILAGATYLAVKR